MPEECDPVTKRCFGAVVRGWRSNHLGSTSGTGGAVGWCTANVFQALTHIRVLLQSLLTANVLTEFNGVLSDYSTQSTSQIQTQSSTSSSTLFTNALQYYSPIETYKNDWNNLMDADLTLSNQSTTLKQELFSRLIQPQIEKDIHALQSFRAPTPAAAVSASCDGLIGSSAIVQQPLKRKTFPASYRYNSKLR